MKFIWTFILTIVFITNMASAHEAGSSLEAVDGNYRLDVGYTGKLSTGAPVLFDFNLFNEGAGMEERFESVWVRLGDKQGVRLSTRLHSSSSDKTILNYRFPEAGEYTLFARYSVDGKSIAEHSFPLVVSGEPQKNQNLPKGVILSAVAGFFVGVLFTRLFF